MGHVLKAVRCCHSHYCGHYDIKPDNFVYSEPECHCLKMIDFGLSSGFASASDDFKGTVQYTAPEVWDGVFGPEADIWSCGVVLYAVAVRKALCPQSYSDDRAKQFVRDRQRVKEKIQAAADLGASKNCLQLLDGMLRIDRHMRFTAQE